VLPVVGTDSHSRKKIAIADYPSKDVFLGPAVGTFKIRGATMASAREEAMSALLALAVIKAAVEEFDRGDCNLFDALDRMKAVLLPAGAAIQPERDAA
jgi:hypothetical protein